MPQIKAVLFDLDDTLWPIVPVIVRAETILFEWLAANAPRVTQQFTIDGLRERRAALIASDRRYQFDLWALRHAGLTEAFRSCGEDPGKVDFAMAVFAEARNAVVPYDDVLPTLSRLRGRVALGSISNGNADLEAIGMAHHFHTSIAAHRFGSAKPDTAIFHAACAAMGVEPAQAVYVGDDPLLDVEGAQKAGLRGVWIKRGDGETQRVLPDHIQPDVICTTFYELEEWLDKRIMTTPPPGARIE